MNTTANRARPKTGDTFQTPMADTMVTFKVIHVRGDRVTATAVPDPIEIDGVTYPGDYDGHTRDFLIEEAAAAIRHTRAMEAHFAATQSTEDAFWASRAEGDRLHVHNSGDAWIRGEVVIRDGQKMFLPTGLVGTWARHDLPMRRADGTIHHPYHARKIIDGEASTPAAWSIWESGSESVRSRLDPTTRPALTLTLPDPTPEEAEEHAREALLNAINRATTAPAPSTDRIAQIRALIAGAEATA